MRQFALLAGAALLMCLGPVSALAQDVRQAENEWFTAADAAIKARLARQPNTSRAKNIILFVSDGNGVGTNYAVRLFQGQKLGKFGDEHVLSYEAMPHLALVKTYNVNAQTPDSAGTSTAMNAGVKTNVGVIGVDSSVNRGDCSAVEAGKLTTIGTLANAAGKAVGYISTARITHATPASGYAHSADRNWEDDSKLPDGCNQKDIARQLIDKMVAGDVDLAMGGGRRHFLPADTQDEEGKNGRRGDGADLIAEAKSAGIQYAWNDLSFAKLSRSGRAGVLGLFESSHMKYEHDRAGEPSLSEMTAFAIESLSHGQEGYFLLVEAGRVDHANHRGNLHRTVTDGVAFADAVATALKMTDARDTLIVVTADHEHSIAFNGYCGRGSPITGLCYKVNQEGVRHLDEPNLGDDKKPYTVAGFLNGPGSVLKESGQGVFVGERPALTNDDATDPDYLQQALIPLQRSETHSGEDVAVYAQGPWAHLLDGTIEQNMIFHVMRHAMTAE